MSVSDLTTMLKRRPASPPSSHVEIERAQDLLRRPDFRRAYLAVTTSELGDALHYIALMWFAFDVGGAAGVIAVRVADSVPAIVFGLHGGIAADRFSRKRLMVGADVTRALVLAPVGRWPRGPAAALGTRRSLVRPRDRDELLRACIRRARSDARRAAERPARERARPVDGAGRLDRRLGP